MHIGKHTGI